MNRMFNKLRTLFTVLIIIICGAANADLAAIAYADAENEVEQGYAAQDMDLILNENIYEIQQETSKMQFHVNSPIGDIWASFQDFEGRFLMLNSRRHHAMAAIDISADSLDTDGGFIGVMLKSESFFDVENFPTMRFIGSSFEWYSDRRGVLKGYMTIKNITRQVAFFVDLVDADVACTGRMLPSRGAGAQYQRCAGQVNGFAGLGSEFEVCSLRSQCTIGGEYRAVQADKFEVQER